MTTIEAIKEACIALKEKAILSNSEGKAYIFESEQDVYDFFQPFWDKQTHGRYILLYFIEFCYRESTDYFSYKELGLTSGLYNPDAPKIQRFLRPDKTVTTESDNKDRILIQLPFQEVLLIQQALVIASEQCKKLHACLGAIVNANTTNETRKRAQGDYTYYWLDLAEEFIDLNYIINKQKNLKNQSKP